jgi:serine/threonine-protein kinase
MDVRERAIYRIETFGGLVIAGGTSPMTGAATQRKTMLLLAVIAAAGEQGVSREKLLGLFWPEFEMERARNALKQALHILRRDLHEPELVSAGPTVRLNPACLASDVLEFEDALARGELERAVELYRGPFLDGLYLDGALEFERWVDRERGRLAHLHAAALEKLATDARAAGDHRSAIDWWRRLAATDPLSSRVAVELMTSLAAAGEPEAALQHARVHEALVRQELDAPPDPSIGELVERLRDDLRAGHAREPREDRSLIPGGAPPDAATPAARDDRSDRAVVRRFPHWRLAIVLATVLTILGAAGAWRIYGGARPVPVERSVAVLPFIDIGGNPDAAYFSDGISEELITALSRIEGLRVAARTSSFALRDAKLDMRTIGDTLGVAAVVEGSVRRDGDRLRVTAQLIDATSGYHLWSEAYDREVKDVFVLQDEIARAIAGVLHVKPAESPGGAPLRTVSSEVYDLHLRGAYLRNRLSRDALVKAVDYYDQAIALDSGYALAYAGKASAMGPLFYFRHMSREPGLSEMRAAAKRALELDDGLGEAHVAMGIVHFFYDWNWRAAEREFRRATELNPGDSHAFHMLANYLRALGRTEEGIAARRRALELDPLNGRTTITLAGDYLGAGDYDQAAALYRRALDVDSLNPLLLGLGPNLPAGPGKIHEWQGRPEAAVEEYLRVASRRGATPDELSELRAAFAERGMPGFWNRWLAFEERTSAGEPRALRVAAIWARSGDLERAVEWLERAYRERDPGLVYLGVDPEWTPVRGDRRVRAMLEEMGLPR